jgi:hypothetical protein
MAIRTKGSSRAPNPTTLVTTWLKSTRTRWRVKYAHYH